MVPGFLVSKGIQQQGVREGKGGGPSYGGTTLSHQHLEDRGIQIEEFKASLVYLEGSKPVRAPQ